MGGFVTKVGDVTKHTSTLSQHAGTFYDQYQGLQRHVGRNEDSIMNVDTEIFDVEGSNECGQSWMAIGIVVVVVILLVVLVRFASSERLVSNSPQLLSHEDVELREYSYYVPKLKLPYMFF